MFVWRFREGKPVAHRLCGGVGSAVKYGTTLSESPTSLCVVPRKSASVDGRRVVRVCSTYFSHAVREDQSLR